MIVDKERIIRLYKDGYKACEISLIINEKSRTIQRIIREYKYSLRESELKEIETLHKNNKSVRLEEKKENKKYMQDITMASHNQSAYTINRYGDWVLDINKQICPMDMPLVIKNTNFREYRKTFYNKKMI